MVASDRKTDMSSVLVQELYTPLAEAQRILKERKSNSSLCATITEWTTALPCPPPLDTTPHLVYAPSIVSPNLEMLHLLERENTLGMPLHFYEYTHDKFVHLNYVKRCLGHLNFVEDDAPRTIVKEKRILDFQTAQGKYMDEIRTLSGEGFVEFHHRLLREAVPRPLPPTTDFSAWFSRSKNHSPTLPYARYLGIFIVDGILLANFTTEKHEILFTEQVVLPAFRFLRETFGVKPLIVPVSPIDSDDSAFWNYYPLRLADSCRV
jgi:hypothetical protein